MRLRPKDAGLPRLPRGRCLDTTRCQIGDTATGMTPDAAAVQIGSAVAAAKAAALGRRYG